MGCLSFLATYEEDTGTADLIKHLIDLGAVIVGKTKMTAFASSEKPCDWWGFQCPFNPRADAHLTPGGSSTGSAAATAAYPWLDICIGSDSECSRYTCGKLATLLEPPLMECMQRMEVFESQQAKVPYTGFAAQPVSGVHRKGFIPAPRE